MSKRFRNTLMHQAGSDPADIVIGRVVGINFVNWTVNVATIFDRRRYFDIQISSPYMHYANGEGISIFPDIGAQCAVCIPGDNSPPFVLAFMMPHETINSSGTDAPLGTSSHGNTPGSPTDASFSGGRPLPNPGDIWFTGRDGNFVKILRGGVLQIGASELAQRLYIPLSNLVTDISGTYEHFNTGGAMLWGVQEGAPDTAIPTQHISTFRVFAGNEYADMKVAKGKVLGLMPDPDGGTLLKQGGVGQGKNNEVVFEVAVSPQGFVVPTGEVSGGAVAKASVFHFVFDQSGNTLLRIEGKFTMHVSQPVLLDFDASLTLTGADTFSFKTKNGMTLDGGTFSALKGKIVLIGPGKQPIARMGDATTSYVQNMMCMITPTAPIPVTTPSGPGSIPPGVPFLATITIGVPGQPLPIGGQVVTGEYTCKC